MIQALDNLLHPRRRGPVGRNIRPGEIALENAFYNEVTKPKSTIRATNRFAASKAATNLTANGSKKS
jgi:hypothetical protein